MIEVPNISVSLRELERCGDEMAAVRKAALKKLHIAPDAFASLEIRRRSIDARRGRPITVVYTVRCFLRGGTNAERALLSSIGRRGRGPKVEIVEPDRNPVPLVDGAPLSDAERPVVIGAGCAGLFCAWALARQGLCPVLVERGDDAARRSRLIERFDETGELDCESNVQFGLGGAGTFSDGKLSTGTRSPYHRAILEAFVEGGASPRILFEAKPHVGSDVLPGVVTHIAQEIERLGGQVRTRCRLTGIRTEGAASGRRITGVELSWREEGAAPCEGDPVEAPGVERSETLGASHVVLACGHSARDVFELLRDAGVAMERKTFSMGARIEHLQTDVDRCQYGPAAGSPLLGAAPYKLVSHVKGAAPAYSFCMCPGGYVVAAASEAHSVVTNGMSLAARDGENANSGLLVNVRPADLAGDDVLAGVALQCRCEQAAYEAGGGAFRAPAQLVGDFLAKRPSSGQGHVTPTYPRGVAWGTLDGLLPDNILDAMRAGIPAMAGKLRCFSDPEAVLTGVETRSSSPVRVVRDDGFESVSVAGLFPVGEGAGYAGGIMSAAADGVGCAMALARRIRRPQA